MTNPRTADILQQGRQQVLDLYGDAIGRPVAEVVTPALLLNLPAAHRNINRMAAAMTNLHAQLRPHVNSPQPIPDHRNPSRQLRHDGQLPRRHDHRF